jgi:hypothetical protein
MGVRKTQEYTMPRINSYITRDVLLLLIKLGILIPYGYLIFISPSGEGWGHGWNLIAYWLFASPFIILMGLLHIWRQKKLKNPSLIIDQLTALFAFLFPVLSLMVLNFKLH